MKFIVDKKKNIYTFFYCVYISALYDVCTHCVVVQHELDRSELDQLPHAAVCAKRSQGEQQFGRKTITFKSISIINNPHPFVQ